MRIERVVTHGVFTLDGGTWEVDNNVWIVGDDKECVIIDAAHDAQAIREAIGDRKLRAILLTHAHDDHIGAALALGESTGAPVHLHPADKMLWDRLFADVPPDIDVADGDRFEIAGAQLVAIHTPGHSPGSVCYHLPSKRVIFTGDTLFQGGPGATGRSFSSFTTIVDSIRTRLLTLPGQTVVHTGHGPDTTIAEEAPHLADWIKRGH